MEGQKGHAHHGHAHGPRPIDTTRVLNLFGYVGPVASLMTHTLFSHHSASSGAHGSSGIGGQARAAGHLVRQHSDGLGAHRRPSEAGAAGGGLAGGRTRFVLSRTEDAIDSVLPCAAERMFKRPSKFGNPDALRFSYHG